MHSGKRFGAREFIIWTRRSIYALIILSAIPTVLYFLGLDVSLRSMAADCHYGNSGCLYRWI